MTRSSATVLIVLTCACGVPVDIGTLEGTSVVPVSDSISDSVSDSVSATATSNGTDVPESTTDEATTGAAPDLPPAERGDFAIRLGDLPAGGEDTGTTVGTSASGTGGEDPGDPDTLMIRLTTSNASCESPYGELGCPFAWTYGFNLPVELQFAGATGRIEDHEGFLAETGSADGKCSFGGGDLFGNFEIIAIDETRVSGRIFDLELTSFGTEFDFAAPRCL